MFRNYSGLVLVGLIGLPILWQQRAGGETKPPHPADTAAATARHEANGDCDARCIIARFVGAPDTAPLSQTLARVKQLGYQDLDFLVMLAPDPRDSGFPEAFDSYMNAARSAIEAADFSSDVFYDPWSAVASEKPAKADKADKADAADAAKSAEPSAAYRERPGAFLFRRDTPADPNASPADSKASPLPARRRELLMVLVVGELATWGVQKAALEEALEIIHETFKAELCPGGTAAKEFALRILGPSSSGAAESLRIGLRSWFKAKTEKDPAAFKQPRWRIEMISGSATSRDNQRILAEELAADIRPIHVSFRATVNADDALWHFASGYLRRLGARSSDIALLTESTTDYGQDFRGQTSKVASARDAILNLPFPLHIAESRPDTRDAKLAAGGPDGETATGNFALPKALRDLAWSKGTRGIDSLAAQGKLTLAANDLALTNILRTIASENKHYVGILASDVLDSLFLVQQVRSWFPEVTVIVFTSDLLFLHEAVPFMDGVMVASTYPLAAWTQQASFPFGGDRLRQMFTSEYAQGIYNATLILLDDKRPDDNNNDPRDIVDWGRPFTRPSDDVGPPLWMSVVSHNAFWPLEALDGAPEARDLYTQKMGPSDTESKTDPNDLVVAWRLPSERALSVTMVLFAVLSLLTSITYAIGLASKTAGRTWVRAAGQLLLRSSGFPHPRMHLFGLMSVFLTLGIVGLVLLPFVCIDERLASLTAGNRGWAVKMGTMGTLLIGVGSVWGMFGAAARRWLRPAADDDENDVAPRVLLRCACLGIAAVALAALAILEGLSRVGVGRFNPGDGAVQLMFLYYRARSLLSGQSLLALAGVQSIGYLIWIGGHLRQVRIHQSVRRLREWGMLGVGPNQSPLFKLLGIEKQSAAAVTQAEKVVPSTGLKLLMAAFYVVVTLLLLPGIQLFEKTLPLGGVTWFFPTMYLMIVGFLFWGCYSFVATWAALRGLLGVLATHPIAAAFRRIPPQLAEVFRHPWSDEIENVWRHHCIVLFNNANALSRLPSPVPSLAVAQSGELADFMATLAPLEEKIARGLYLNRPDRPLGIALKPEEFDKLDAVSTVHLIRSAVPDDAHLWNRLWEEFLALRLVALIGYVRAQIYNVIGTVSLATVPILLVTSLYPFSGHRTVLMLVVTLVTAVIATTLTVFTQMNRNTLMSLIDGTKPGSVSWDRSYVSGLVLHGAVPLLTLISVKFPGAAQAIRSLTGLIVKATGQ